MAFGKDWDEETLQNLMNFDEHIKESTVKLNYEYITEHYFEMYEVAMNNGTILPYRFNPIGLAYRGHDHDRPTRLSNMEPEIKEKLQKAYAKRNELQYKYANPKSNQKLKYEEFLDKEIYDFIEELPQYKDIIL